MPKISPNTTLAPSVSYIEAKCSELGIPKPTSFAYPGNRTDSLSQITVQDLEYQIARAGGSQPFDPESDNKLNIPSYTVGSADKLRDRVTGALENLRQGGYLILTFHGVPDLVHQDYSTSPDFFRELLEIIKRSRYRVISIKEWEWSSRTRRATKDLFYFFYGSSSDYFHKYLRN